MRRPILTTRFAWIIAAVVGILAVAHIDHHGANAQTITISSADSDAIREAARDTAREQTDSLRSAAQDRVDAAREAADAAREQAEAFRDQARDNAEAMREAARAERDALREEARALRDAHRAPHIRITIPSTIDIDTNS